MRCILLLVLFVAMSWTCRGEDVRAEATYYADACAEHYNVPTAFVEAIITQESGWKKFALSEKGAMGLMQLMPKTAREVGVANPYDLSQNICGGVRLLSVLNQQYKGDLRLVAAAYYCGTGPLKRRGLSFRSKQVYEYVQSVETHYERIVHRSESSGLTQQTAANQGETH